MQSESLNTRREGGFGLRAQVPKSQWRLKTDSAEKQILPKESRETPRSVSACCHQYLPALDRPGRGQLLTHPLEHVVEVVSNDALGTGLKSSALKQLQKKEGNGLKLNSWGLLWFGEIIFAVVRLFWPRSIWETVSCFSLMQFCQDTFWSVDWCQFLLYFWKKFFTPESWKTCRPRAVWAELPHTKWELKWLD